MKLDLRLSPHLSGVARLQTGSSVLFAGQMLGNGVAYLYHIVMARALSPTDYGTLVTLVAIATTLTVVTRTVQAWVIKTVAADIGAGQTRAIFQGALRKTLVIATLALATFWLTSGQVANFLHLPSATPVLMLGVYTFTAFIRPTSQGVLLGHNRLHVASLVYMLEPTTRLVIGTLLVGWSLGVNGALAGYALGNFVAFAIPLALFWSRSQPGTPSSTVRNSRGDVYALNMLLVNAGLMFLANIDQIAVKHFFSDQIAGNYAVAFMLGQIIAMSTMALGWVLFTRSAMLPASDARRARLLMRGLLVMASIAVTLTLGYLVAPRWAVALMGGAQYLLASEYVGLVGIETTLFALVYLQVYTLLAMHQTRLMWPLAGSILVALGLIGRYHASVQHILVSLIVVLAGLLVYVSVVSWRLLWVEPRASARPSPLGPLALTRPAASRGQTVQAMVVVPTYNERDNLASLVGAILGLGERFHVTIVDDNSPDGTGEIADRLAALSPRVHVIHRAGKQGLGSAYRAGFAYALHNGADYIFEMDADFSHDPGVLPQFLELMADYDVVVGSRYAKGLAVVHWPLRRLFVSLTANLYARWMTGLDLHDCTSGFKCFKREVLESIDLGGVYANGYAFQVELNYRAQRLGYRVGELPIIFYERRSGASKMSIKIAREAFWHILKMRLSSLLQPVRFAPLPVSSAGPTPRKLGDTATSVKTGI